MLQLFSDDRRRIGTLSGFSDLKETTKLNSGDKEISFKYPQSGAFFDDIRNEYYIRTKTDEYVIKSISGGSKTQWLKVIATLNLEDLEGKAFKSFKTTEMTVRACLGVVLDGTGWTVGVCQITKRRTIKKDAPCNAVDIISQIISTYACEITYDTLNKRIDIYEQIGDDKGCYFIESLNLRKLQTDKTSYDFYTRIIPIGKDGLQIDIDGRNYIENHGYSSKVKTYIWKDERYTIPASLAEDAARKLAEVSKPYEVYETDVIDLASLNPVYSEILHYDIGDVVWLISKKSGVKAKMRIAKIVKYPLDPKQNTCELSNTKKSFADIQAEQTAEIVGEAVAAAGSNTTEQIEASEGLTSEEIALELDALKTEILATVADSYASDIDVSAGDDEAVQTAKAYTDTQLDNYKTSEQTENAIDAAKRAVLSDVQNTYASKASVSEALRQTGQATAEAIAGAVAGIETELADYATNDSVKNALSDYSTTEQMQEAIGQAQKITDTETQKSYKFGVSSGLIYLEEIE